MPSLRRSRELAAEKEFEAFLRAYEALRTNPNVSQSTRAKLPDLEDFDEWVVLDSGLDWSRRVYWIKGSSTLVAGDFHVKFKPKAAKNYSSHFDWVGRLGDDWALRVA
jgi:hypothetical protein